MNSDAEIRRYPYGRGRVILSGIITVLSTVFALTLLLGDPVLVLYYFLSTFIVTAITFFLKKRLYHLLVTDSQAEITNDRKHSTWKMLLVAFLMLVGFIAVPLLLAELLSGPIWFMMITSLMSGVSISEIILYFQAKGKL